MSILNIVKTFGADPCTSPTNLDCIDDPMGGQSLMETVTKVINVVIGLVGLISVVMIIYGGIQYTLSAGDSGKVKKAKDTILYGIIGLIIALLAFAIVNFVIGSL